LCVREADVILYSVGDYLGWQGCNLRLAMKGGTMVDLVKDLAG
jgi:hypothetical protein